MDRLIYIAMSGAKHTLWQQAVTAHNLANAATSGYRAEITAFRALPATGSGAATRAWVADSTIGADFTPGVLQQTGRDLDVALQGKGWIAVQASDGAEAYTRNGNLQAGAGGVLQTRNGFNVLGEGGPISIPPDSIITVAEDGTVSAIPSGQTPNAVMVVGRIKLVNPPENALTRGADGLFRQADGASAAADASVRLAAGAIEGSNVNAVEALTGMISHARQFDMQIKLLQNAETNASKAGQLLNMNG